MTEFNGAEVVVGLPSEIALASTSRYHYRVNKSTSHMLACCPSVRCEKGSLVDGARPSLRTTPICILLHDWLSFTSIAGLGESG